MAEYKYRALGWKDDDIASLNVVDETASDNQVELQITKQGAGTIDGPAIVGKDGITIDKAADSEKIEISGSGCIQDPLPGVNNLGAPVVLVKDSRVSNFSYKFLRKESVSSVNEGDLIGYDGGGAAYVPNVANDDKSITNKKYVDDNFVKKGTSTNKALVYARILDSDTMKTISYNPYFDAIPLYNTNLTLKYTCRR